MILLNTILYFTICVAIVIGWRLWYLQGKRDGIREGKKQVVQTYYIKCICGHKVNSHLVIHSTYNDKFGGCMCTIAPATERYPKAVCVCKKYIPDTSSEVVIF